MQNTPNHDWTPLHAHLHRTLKERRLLERSQQVLVAVSGGQDSLCLVKLLLDLQPKWGWQLAIAHCNHRWRADADANAEHVQQLAQGWQLPYYQQTAEAVTTSEAAARQWRYKSLTTIAQQYRYTCIVTGHTASDRAETLLYNLMRGSGADGLQALVWERPLTLDIKLVRPLLDVTRAETRQFCQTAQLQIWDDTTNHDLTYARNRIRQELLPYLQTHFNPQAENALSQTAALLQADVEYLEAQAAALLEQAQHADRPGLNRTILQQSALALQRRIMRQFLQQALPCAPNFGHIEKLVSLITAPNRSQTDPFPGGTIAYVEDNWIWLKPASGDDRTN
ncbi:tRNA lysidine(34) synthetase TilS [Stenomitos frigidus]|uniref:tRNA(Ile)-lysidine synthase n=1 Tax=Stenomitos frigidus ULC18 TaxID=2107698 RepID=A0A2T1E2B4_9CYAN|nr:tRNA lysidine(34) synthetase TilS [Stenomitos frigidus]PSB26888.1 tRNA lysidine(34) synthetase TilS [Stenomitos frigidus ULC18]